MLIVGKVYTEITDAFVDQFCILIKDETGNATANPIHISASSGEAIDGLSVFTIDSDHGAITLYCTSTGWHVT